MMKKILSIAMSLIFLFTAASPCFAATTLDVVDAALLERGYPADVIGRMDTTQKLMFYEDPTWVYSGSTSIEYSEDQNDSSIQPRGQIPVSDLTLYFDLFHTAYEGELDQIFVQFHYRWQNIPFFRWQDPIAISWDDTKFRLKDDSFYKVDKYSGFPLDTSDGIYFYDGEVHSLETGYAYAGPAGVSWYADLKGDIGVTVTELFGFGYFFLVPAHGVTVYEGESSTLYAQYVHPTAAISLGINISSYGNFSISAPGGYDERGTQLTFTITDMTED